MLIIDYIIVVLVFFLIVLLKIFRSRIVVDEKLHELPLNTGKTYHPTNSNTQP